MAQIHWTSATNSDFNGTTFWSTGTVPGPADDAIIDAVGLAAPVDYTVTSTVSETVLSIQTNIFATLNITGGAFDATAGTNGGVNAGSILIENNTSFEIGGVFDNTGLVSLLAGNNATDFVIAAAGASLTGSGQVVLSNDLNNAIVGAGAAATLTNVDDLISGAGQIGVGQLTLVNDAAGVIEATGANVLAINTGAALDTNSGLMEAIVGSLVLQNFTVDQSGGGTILAGNGQVVLLEGAELIGGVLQTTGNGAIQAQSGINLLDGVTSTVSNQGLIEILNNAALEISGAIDNTGTIESLAGNNATDLLVTANAVISGAGQVTLDDDTNNIIIAAATGVSLTNVDNVISGAGAFGDGRLLFVNDAGGTLEATGLLNLIVNVGAQTAVNDGLFEGEASGGLIIQDSTIDNSGGAIIAVSNSYVGLQSADIVGGLVNGEAGGAIKTLDGGSQLDGTATHPVTVLGNLTVVNNTALTVIGTIDLSRPVNGVTFTGTVTLAATNNATDLAIGQANATVIGGDIVMTDDGNNEITGVVTSGPAGPTAVSTLTNRSFISGTGTIGTNLRLVNDTAIEADGVGALVIATGNGGVAGSDTITNNGLLESANPSALPSPGGLELDDDVVANTLGRGVIEATGAATHVDLKSVTIEGGTLKTAGGGVIQTVDAGSVLDGAAASVTNDGQVDIENNTALTVVGVLDNVGQIDMQAGNNGTDLIVGAAGVTLTGAGQVNLSNSGVNLIHGLGTGVLTNVNNTISGAGQLGVGELDIINDAKGVIDANAATLLELYAGAAGVTNYGLLEATGAGDLDLVAREINDTAGGVILAATGSSVDLQVADIVGGILETAGTGVIQTVDTGNEFDGSAASLTIAGLVDIQNNTELMINGQIVNQDTILINGGNNGTDLVIGAAGVSLTGGGQVSLSDSGNNRIYGLGTGDVLTNVNNTIAGAGQLGVGDLDIVNDAKGVIDANAATVLQLYAGGAGVTNYGLIEATGPGGLDLVAREVDDSAGGVILAATGSSIDLQAADIVGGLVETSGSGVIQTVDAGNELDGSTASLTISGLVNIQNNTALMINGQIVNQGTIQVDAGNNGTGLQVAGAGVSLSGDGQVILSNSGNNRLYSSVAGSILTNVDNTISGAGQLGAGGLGLINDSAGIIDADDATALVLNVGAASVANIGLIEATGAGGLTIQSSTVDDSEGGVLLAATSSVINLADAHIVGGEIETAGTGVFETADSSSVLDGTTQAVTLSGQVNILNNEALTLDGTLDNLGEIAVLAGNNGTELIADNATLTGKGLILLGDDPNNIVVGSSGVAARLVNVNNTISGAGQLGAGNLILINDAAGKIEATGANALVINTGANSVANAGLIEALGTGGLVIQTTLDNSKGGVLEAANGSLINLQNADLVGGTLKTVGSGFFQVEGGTNLLDGSTFTVKNLGSIIILNNCGLDIAGATDNAGSINVDAGNNGTVLQVDGTASLTGGGQVTLADANAIIFGGSATADLTNVDNVISGAGQIGGGNLTLINDAGGLINASGTGALIINANGTVTNDGMIEATGTGGLTVACAVNGAGGGEILAATGSTVTLQNGTILGGTLARTGTGRFVTTGGISLIDGSAAAVSNQAEIDIVNNTGLDLAGTIVNTGVIAVQAGNNGTELQIDAAAVFLTGAGQVVLTDDANNLIEGAATTDTLVNVANTISGAGQIGAGVMTLNNRAAGLIDGNGANQLVINTGPQVITNAGRIEATGVGGVLIDSDVANTGILEVDGGDLTASAAVTGTGSALIHGGVITFDSAFTGSARFTGASGTLVLAQSQAYAGKVSGFSTHGAAGTDYIDLDDIAFVGVGEGSFKGNAAGGILIVTDGTHTATIALVGNYTRSGFVASSDGHGGTLITLGKRLPVAIADSYVTRPNKILTESAATGVLANDVDPNGLTLSAILAPNGGPAHGTLVLNPDGSFTYTPDRGYKGSDSFTYIARDADGSSAATTVALTVGAGGPPVTKPSAYNDAAGQTLTVTAANGVLANDRDLNGLPLTATLAPGDGPQHGVLHLNANGSFTYTPTLGFAGTDTFEYIAGDSESAAPPTLVTITVTAGAPATKAQTFGDAAGHTLTVNAAGGVLADDTDPNGLSLTATLAPGGGPAHGTLTLNPDGSFTYTPASGFAGKDSFTYIASDSLASSVSTTVSLTVTAAAPTSQADAYSDPAGKVLTVTAANGVLANDTDANGLPLTAALAPGMGPKHGTLTLNANGSFTYTPVAGFAGTDSFDYIASDALSSGQPTLVTITLTASPPITHPETYDAVANQTLIVDAANGVLANDTDPNGLKLTATLAPGGGPEYGTLKLNADGSFTYILNSGFGGFSGIDTFSYIASDGVAQSSPTTVTIDISNGQASAAPSHAAVLSQFAAGMGAVGVGTGTIPHAAFTPVHAPLFAPTSHVAVS